MIVVEDEEMDVQLKQNLIQAELQVDMAEKENINLKKELEYLQPYANQYSTLTGVSTSTTIDYTKACVHLQGEIDRLQPKLDAARSGMYDTSLYPPSNGYNDSRYVQSEYYPQGQYIQTTRR